jgi:hypothetical protein
MTWLRRIFHREDPQRAVKVDAVLPANPAEIIGAAFGAHAHELDAALTPDVRAKILGTWRTGIDREAHDYADLVLSHPRREAIMRLEVETIMQSYLCGYMASRGWLDKVVAQQAPYVLGSSLRNELRRLGVSLQSVSATFGVVMNETLQKIVHLAFTPKP